jgi:3-dehydroquinate dehydratase-2
MRACRATGASAALPDELRRLRCPRRAHVPNVNRPQLPQRLFAMTTILLLQGANMAYLGKRQPEIYGTTPAAELDRMMQRHAKKRGVKLEICYTHIEGEAIGRIYRAADEKIDGLLMNPAGFTYAGYALRDCLKALTMPAIEIHMTNIEKRGMHSVTAEATVGMVMGFGIDSYFVALEAMVRQLAKVRSASN